MVRGRTLAPRCIKDWVLPAAMERVRRKLASADGGNRQMVDILTAVLTDGLPADNDIQHRHDEPADELGARSSSGHKIL
jgi:hypothetical protein